MLLLRQNVKIRSRSGVKDLETKPFLPAESAPDGALFYFMGFYVYIIQSQKDGSYYKGYTENYYERLIQHNSGVSKYTSRKTPWVLVYLETYELKHDALVREKER